MLNELCDSGQPFADCDRGCRDLAVTYIHSAVADG